MTIHEPATLLTDYLLALLGGYLAWRLHRSPSMVKPATRWWFRALLVLTVSAFVGGSYHGFAPNLHPTLDAMWWRVVLWIICLLGFTMGQALVCEAAPASKQTFWRRFLTAKLMVACATILIFPDFLIAIVDYGFAMLAWLVAALVMGRTWSPFIIIAVTLSALAAWIQQSGVSWFTHLNHNDVFHLVQAFTLVGFHQAAQRMSWSSTTAVTEDEPSAILLE